MKKIIVTGATGFIGSHLIYKLIDYGYEVGIFCRNSSTLDKFDKVIDKIKIYKVNNDLENMIVAFNEFKPECIVHLAAIFKAEHTKDDINSFIDTNIKYPTLILEAMKQCGINSIINTGTAWQHYNNEEYNPVCFYAATKESFEKMIDYYVKAINFKCITLKIFDSYGDNDTRGKLISELINCTKSNKILNMTKGESKIDLIYIDDIVSGFIQAIDYLDSINYGEHRKYALCTERRLTLKEVIGILEQQTGHTLNIKWGARAYRQREIMEPWSKYEILPNWSSRVSLEEGIKKLCN